MTDKERFKTIYHGTDHLLEKPVFGKGSAGMDYGRGFYTTEDKEWGKAWGRIYGKSETAAYNVYELDTKDLNILSLDDYGPLSLLAELLSNRELVSKEEHTELKSIQDFYKVNTSKADVIVGMRANGAYLKVCESFLNGYINLDEMTRLFKKGDMGEQLFLKSEKAFAQIKHIGYDRVKEEHPYEKVDFVAKKETLEFLIQREKDVKCGLYEPSGILVKDVVHDYFKYDKESGYCYVSDYEELEEPDYGHSDE